MSSPTQLARRQIVCDVSALTSVASDLPLVSS